MKGYRVTRTCRFGKVAQGLLSVGLRWSLAVIALAVGGGHLVPSWVEGQGPTASPVSGELLPTGVRITPTAAEGAIFQPLNPDLPDNPDFTAGQAVATSISPDGTTLLILTSGFNRNFAPDGSFLPEESNEYVFVYDISWHPPVKKQVLQIPNTFNGIVWHPKGREFYVSGGVDDNVHVFEWREGLWSEVGDPIPLGYTAGEGLDVSAVAAGLAVNAGGTLLLVANFENDSVSVIDLKKRAVVSEVDLRPGKVDPAQQGVPGGEFPFWVVIKGDDKAYVSSQRDREIVVLDLRTPVPTVTGRIAVSGQPNRMLFNRAETRLYVANDNSDTVAVIDTSTDRILEEISTTAPKAIFPNTQDFKGSNPNSLALSPDERTLFVTNGGTNSVAVIRLWREEDRDQKKEDDEEEEEEEEEELQHSRMIGLIPTGWYPNAVSVNKQGSVLYVVNGKTNAGPNPGACRDTLSTEPGALDPCTGRNLYMWQLTKAGFLSLQMPSAVRLAKLTWQVAANNNFPAVAGHQKDDAMMAFLRSRIKHVIYIVKENRTYDQVLGDLEVGNGDPSLALFPEPISPNHHALARNYVTLDNFLVSGGVSGDGWNWSTAARATDYTEKTVPVNYGGRGLTYDWEGTNRNINVGLGTVEERQAAMPYTPDDPDLLPGTADVAAPDAPKGEAGTGYLWDAALRKGLTVRNYGFFVDLARYFLPPEDPAFIPVVRNPFEQGIVQAYPVKPSLQSITDPYFRGYDQKNADFWLFKEWEREFDEYVKNDNLPNLQLVRFPHDHFGDFASAIDGVNTPESQMADNDYAVGLLVEKVSKSPYKDSTLIFVIEDDAQDGGDHVDAHRSVAHIVGPYVKQGAVVSMAYNTVSMIRTIEDILGLEPLGLTDGLAAPMSDVFEETLRPWTYTAIVPEVLRTTELPLPPRTASNSLPLSDSVLAFAKPRHDASYWQKAMGWQNFKVEDKLDPKRFNEALWLGLMGEEIPYPETRHGRDLSRGREGLLKEYRQSLLQQFGSRVGKTSAQ
jgi:YVTN family beta-propeller protein